MGWFVAIALPMTRTEIADYLGLTLETVCRTLSDLARRKLIAIGGDKPNHGAEPRAPTRRRLLGRLLRSPRRGRPVQKTIDRSILIIGAGIGGLATGCAQMNGYRARILEMHTRPGGLCTAWGRHGYIIDGCIHNLGGTSPRSVFHQLWRELGVVPKISFHGYEELVTVERSDGPPLVVYTDLDRLSAHMKELSPVDAPLVDELIAGARHFTRLDFMGLALANTFERIASVASALPWSNTRG